MRVRWRTGGARSRGRGRRGGRRRYCQGARLSLCSRAARGRSSGVEHNLAKVGVEGSNPFARSKSSEQWRPRRTAARVDWFVTGLSRRYTFLARSRLIPNCPMIDLHRVMERLAGRRPVFHSEADFQHELAWELRQLRPLAPIRLERPLANGQRGAIDVVIAVEGRQHALELKYLSRRFEDVISGEHFALKQHSAHDIRRYDVCKDIHRMEEFSRESGWSSAVLVLTNDPAFWNNSDREGSCDVAFRIGDGRALGGTLEWAPHTSPGTQRRRERPIPLTGRYSLCWRDFSNVGGRAGKFRYLQIDVAGPATMSPRT
jgi:hypothetical protein